MRYIHKTEAPASFTAWKNLANRDWQPTYDALQNPEKRILHTKLVEEQGRTCCYCGIEIDLKTSHIEHFRPQHPYGDLALEYSNLFASCLRELNPRSPLRCGHLKSNWFDDDNHVSPTDPQCEAQFNYQLNGEIGGLSLAASEMVDVLGLNSPLLENRRRQALLIFDEAFLDSATDEEIIAVATNFRTYTDSGLPAFFHVVARFAEQLLQ